VIVNVVVGVPTVTVKNPTPNPANTGATVTVTFSVSSTATVTGIIVNWGDGTTNTLPGTATSDTHVYASTGTAKSQTFTITVMATNSAGPGSGTTTEVVNDRPPVVTTSSVVPVSPFVGQLVTVSFTATDPDGTISSISVNWGDGTALDTLAGTATSDMHTYSIAGTFTLTVSATDNSGSTGQATNSVTTAVPVGVPTVTVNTPTPNPANTGATVTVTFSVSSTATVTGITVNWGDGTTPDSLAGTAVSDMHIYTSTGNAMSKTFTITVTATNSAGHGSGTTTETVNDRSPLASFTFTPTSPSAGQAVNFDATASADPDGTIANYAWNFGDGTTGTGATTIHVYNPSATTSFTVTLTVTDNSGSTGSTSQSVTVTVSVVSPPVVTVSNIAPNPADTGQMVTVTFTVSSTVTITGITVNWGDGTTNPLAGTATTDTHTYTTAGTFTVTVTATNSAGPGSATTQETVTAVTGNPVLLTFQGFDLDDFDNGVGQLQVFVNGHLVVDIPAGLNHLSGTGHYALYTNTWVNFGPFDITSFVIHGQNTIVFMSPPPGHFGLVKNVTITQGNVLLLHVMGARFVSLSHSVTFTFSIPPLVITSFTVSNSTPLVGEKVTLSATYTGGTAPFKCVFEFANDESASAIGTAGGCSVTHAYDDSGNFTASVIVIGSSTSDRVSSSLQVTVTGASIDPPSAQVGQVSGEDSEDDD
jgi:PKD repeat protein